MSIVPTPCYVAVFGVEKHLKRPNKRLKFDWGQIVYTDHLCLKKETQKQREK